MFALVDCNNFYASCERLFNPKLYGRPIIVLSNNDGCAIARSDEAKAIGIVMGSPAYQLQDVIKQNNVAVFSSNYTLYGDISDRVMKTLSMFVPTIEIYSIDEAFLDMRSLKYADLYKLGLKIKKTVKKNIGIPVSVGIAPTKALAKMANRFAKKTKKDVGVHLAGNTEMVNEMLAYTNIGDVWGIGHQYSLFLQKNGFKTAFDFVNAPEEWVRKEMTVVGQRLYNELKGTTAIQWEDEVKDKKNICTSRSFGNLLSNKAEIKEALVNYAANCALKLRLQKCCCRKLKVYVQTNQHRTEDRQYNGSITIDLNTASNTTSEIIKYATKALDIVFRANHNYLKCGIEVLDLVPEDCIQTNLFNHAASTRHKDVMKALDKINKSLGKEVVRMAVQGFEKRYRLKAEHLSPCYTTNINHILKVKN